MTTPTSFQIQQNEDIDAIAWLTLEGNIGYASMYWRFTIGDAGFPLGLHQDWSLHIKYVQPDDAGLYECQVTSHPPASIFVDLQLVEARAEIIGGPDKIVKSGSPLILSCLLRRSTEQPEYIFWYHGERMINYDLGGGATVRHGRQSSELLIPNADIQHAGNYSCVPSNAEPVSVNVHVLIQHAGNYSCVPSNAEPVSVNVHVLHSK
ncbi:hypothetical protein QE152_g21685 [Popillia japonica]|uniref:Ig-like domain-containing protein n=1 Tax=Popillia japonica TaxID=7064 RepID=A0AAW1KL99_POPJA